VTDQFTQLGLQVARSIFEVLDLLAEVGLSALHHFRGVVVSMVVGQDGAEERGAEDERHGL
jgi:hypothetical protein